MKDFNPISKTKITIHDADVLTTQQMLHNVRDSVSRKHHTHSRETYTFLETSVMLSKHHKLENV